MTKMYQELFEQIQALIASENYDTAKQLIQEELKMPYIPHEVEVKLFELKQTITSHETTLKAVDMETLEHWFESETMAPLALGYLKYHNLRKYPDLVLKMAQQAPSKEILSMFCLELKQQGIEKVIAGIDLKQLEVPYENEGFQWLYQQIRDKWQQEQAMVEILSQLLVHEYLLILPNYYALNHLNDVYVALVKEGLSLSKGLSAWYDYTAKNHVDEPKIELAIQRLALKD